MIFRHHRLPGTSQFLKMFSRLMQAAQIPPVLMMLLLLSLALFAGVSAGGGQRHAPLGGRHQGLVATAAPAGHRASAVPGASLSQATLNLVLRGGGETADSKPVHLNFRRHTFHWPGSLESKVELCGSWSGWTAFDEMTKGEDGFTLDVDVPFGKHTYKFILDGNSWTTSEEDLVDVDERGNKNNVVVINKFSPNPVAGTSRIVRFTWPKWPSTQALGGVLEKVEVVGSWSGWTKFDELKDVGESFEGNIQLSMGKHVFKFILDSKIWTHREGCEVDVDSHGNMNNVVTVDLDTEDAEMIGMSPAEHERLDFEELEARKAAKSKGPENEKDEEAGAEAEREEKVRAAAEKKAAADKADKEKKERKEREEREAMEKKERAAKNKAEKEAKARELKEKREKEERERKEMAAREKAYKEAKAKEEREEKERVAKEKKAAAQKAKEAERAAERAAKELLDEETREKAEKEAKGVAKAAKERAKLLSGTRSSKEEREALESLEEEDSNLRDEVARMGAYKEASEKAEMDAQENIAAGERAYAEKAAAEAVEKLKKGQEQKIGKKIKAVFMKRNDPGGVKSTESLPRKKSEVGRAQQNGQQQKGGRAVGGTADSRQEWLDDLSSKNSSRKTGGGQGSGGKSPSKADALFSWFCKTSPPKSPSNERSL